MRKMRLHLFITFLIVLSLFLVGTFFDLEISSKIADSKNGFALFISVIGMFPGYAIFAICAGGFLVLFTKTEKLLLKIIYIILTVGCMFIAIFYTGREFFGPNGFLGAAPRWIGYLISLPFMVAAGYLGLCLFKKCETKNIVIIVTILLVALFLTLVPGISLIKSIFHRPRFRAIAANAGLEFKYWFQTTPNYKELMANFGLISEEFKSFPSGHASASFIFAGAVVFLPYLNKKLEKHQVLIYYLGVAWAMLVALARILAGAHFLSDVSMGIFITFFFIYIANEIVIKLNDKKVFE